MVSLFSELKLEVLVRLCALSSSSPFTSTTRNQMSDQPETPSRKNADIFPDSRWTLVVRAQSAPGTSAFDALNSLCSIYWQPIYAFIRRSGLSSEEAEDLTQGYLQNLMDRNYLSQASPEKGKLRAFLLADLKLYLSNERRRANSQKRGGGKLFIPIDRQWAEEYYTHEPADEVSPADLFDRRWAMTLLDRVLQLVREDYSLRGRDDLFDALKQFISWNAGEEPYADVAERLGRDTNYVKQNVLRLRKLYRRILEEEVGHTVSSPDEVLDEIRHLAASLC